MHRPHRSDRSTRGLVRLLDRTAARRHRQDPESGQATTEFALILFPLLLLVAGIIQFGIGLNYWLDMQRIANQGARWAAVDCGQKASSPIVPNPCSPSLAATLKAQALTQGLENGVCVEISYPSKTGTYTGKNAGDPVKVRLQTLIGLVPILGVGHLKLGADATMRLEQVPDNVAEATCPSL
jgi:Flp pilus assembly protein TadG